MGNRTALWLPTLLLLLSVLMGCRSEDKARHVWEQAKIGELVTVDSGADHPAAGVALTRLEVQAYEIPVENLPRLEGLWEALDARGLRYRNHRTFRDNGFRIGKGQGLALPSITARLQEAGAQRVDTIAMTLGDGLTNDIPVRLVAAPKPLTFTALDGSVRNVTLESGLLCWRLQANKIGAAGMIAQVTVYPYFKIPVTETFQELTQRAKSREIAFMTAAFTTRMTAGDLVVLGPERYHGDDATLGDFLLHNPRGRLFFPEDPQDRSGIRPTLTLLLFRCLGVQ